MRHYCVCCCVMAFSYERCTRAGEHVVFVQIPLSVSKWSVCVCVWLCEVFVTWIGPLQAHKYAYVDLEKEKEDLVVRTFIMVALSQLLPRHSCVGGVWDWEQDCHSGCLSTLYWSCLVNTCSFLSHSPHYGKVLQRFFLYVHIQYP